MNISNEFNQDLHMVLIKKFESNLAGLQVQRTKRTGNQPESGETYPQWAVFEITTMHEHVNKEREKIGRDPISLEEVFRADKSAIGHSDYSHKFSLYCAQLVQDIFG